ncbi:hypothetical protein KY334_07895 [Candidatus Woesearchaeota archaeon]|nr:hypothetical protein [Candidatus Woesearchaeota archaeon]
MKFNKKGAMEMSINLIIIIIIALAVLGMVLMFVRGKFAELSGSIDIKTEPATATSRYPVTFAGGGEGTLSLQQGKQTSMMMQVYNSQANDLVVDNVADLTFQCLPQYSGANTGHVVATQIIGDTIVTGATSDIQVILQAKASPEIYSCKVTVGKTVNVTSNLKLTIK